MSASNIFGRGFGSKKIELILEEVPDILESKISTEDKLIKLKSVKGLGEKTANLFVDKIDEFKLFLINSKLTHKLNNTKN